MVDTPPSRSALDFLDAPARLGRFLDGRMLRLLLAPARTGGRSVFHFFTASFGVFSKAVQRVLGRSCSLTCPGSSARWTRCSAGSGSGPSTPTGCCRIRRRRSSSWRRRSRTRSGRPASSRSGWSRSACRWAGWCSTGCTAPRCRRCRWPTSLAAAEAIATEHPGTASALRVHADLMEQVVRERRSRPVHPALPGVPVVEVPAQPTDVHDLDGLRAIGDALTG